MTDPHDNSGDSGRQLLEAVERASHQLGVLAEQAAEQERIDLSTVLAAAVAHEISNILTPVRGYAEAALERPDDQELTIRALRHAVEGSDRAMRAAEAVIESVGPRRAERGRANVRSAAMNAVQLLGNSASRITVEGDDGLAVIGQISLEQILLNLLINAKAAAASDEFRATIRIHSTWNIRIDVEDSGRGIPATRLPHLFEAGPYGRSGRGLGLLICRHLVEAAGGSIGVRSEVGRGTCFTIELARAAQSQSKAA